MLAFPGIQFQLFAPIVTRGLDALYFLRPLAQRQDPHYDEVATLSRSALKWHYSGSLHAACREQYTGAYETSSELAKAGGIWSKYDYRRLLSLLNFSLGLEHSGDQQAHRDRSLRGEL